MIRVSPPKGLFASVVNCQISHSLDSSWELYHFFHLGSYRTYDSFFFKKCLSYLMTPVEVLFIIEAYWIKPSKIGHQNFFLVAEGTQEIQ